MSDESPNTTTKTIRIGWKDAVFAFLLPALLVGSLFGWGFFKDYYDEPGRNVWQWIWSCLKIGAMIGGGAGIVCFFLTLLIKDIIIRWNDKP
ncbi:MAG: hypothetical protein AB1457_18260 [Chloroflexota bacterium]|jgi:hypothetical protein